MNNVGNVEPFPGDHLNGRADSLKNLASGLQSHWEAGVIIE